MTADLEQLFNELGLLPPGAHQKPTKNPPRREDYVPWKPTYPGEEPPF